ncbi:DNA primase, small subunit [Trichodelitschia bisporula]|uniref:DNA primase n=1 Tax=Trichodelitschia bisporula TaxID=703511 RepID=A0A6G1I2F6_9PEZI|nr:DNA primase, small subunit [Trichodelitschia bisporula]
MPDAPAPEVAPEEPPSTAGAAVPTEDDLKAMEDMLDSDSDDEFTSSMPQKEEEEKEAPAPARFTDPDVMRAFYARLFPYRHLFQWLNHSPVPSDDFAHREFAFTLPNDIYVRYQSFPTADLFRKQCISMIPSRFEIGPVYSSNPRDRKTLRKASLFRPVSKELVFDIDLTDYDPIRTCCTGANICPKCWTWMTNAIRVLDAALRDDFGFRHVLWVYSGRRGVHAWVCDARARCLDDTRRKAIAGALELLRGGEKKLTLKRPLHPHLERSLRLLREPFSTDILLGQDPWADDTRAASLLDALPDAGLREALRKKWAAAPGRSSASKWADIDAVAKTGGSSTLDTGALLEAKLGIILEYTYPRLDAEVSKKLNHLLKSPFVVHPGTGRVCVPIDPRRVEEFDPFGVPTVTGLLNEIEAWDAECGQEEKEGEKRVQDWEKTSLKPYVEYFRGFIAGLLKDEKRPREEGEGMATDF